MDAQTNLKINNLQRDLLSLEEKEARLAREMEDVSAQIKLLKSELDALMKDDRITNDILGRVYEQRRADPGKKGPKK